MPTHATRPAADVPACALLPARLAACILVVATLGALAPPPAAAATTYRWPVDGEVVRRFDPGSSPYSAGHRGVDLAAVPGTEVRAAAGGTVAFSGVVVGVRWVSLDHPDGVRTSYGPLDRALVRRGQRVARGDAIGLALGDHDGRSALHWSARRDGRYLDPATLVRPPVWRPTLLGPGQWAVTDLPDVPSYGSWDGEHRWGLVPGSPDATGPGWLLPPNPNHVIVIAGFGSESGGFHLDLTDLGYPASAITELSHAGRAGSDPADQFPYGPDDTFVGIDTLARRLRDQLRAHAAAHPGQAVDLVGHSMGGVVALHYLLTMHDPADPTLPPIAHVATFASPLEGAALANLADGVSAGLLSQAVLRLIGAWREATGPSTRDLAVGSALLRALAEAWAQAQTDLYGGPLATGTSVLTVGGSRDLVVPEHRSDLPGIEHVVLPGGHSSVLDTQAARIVLRAFLAGEPPPGQAGGLGHWLSYPVSGIERGVGYVAPLVVRRIPWP
ncbi:MAG TPA: peptidoglycan DD-metalloendopeptidase family protein [Nitriliruptorales bacterium]